MRPSYLYNGNPYTGIIKSLYWDNHQVHIQLYCYLIQNLHTYRVILFTVVSPFCHYCFILVTNILLKKKEKICTKVEMSSLWHFHHWLHQKLSFWQPVTKISTKWQYFQFSVTKIISWESYRETSPILGTLGALLPNGIIRNTHCCRT